MNVEAVRSCQEANSTLLLGMADTAKVTSNAIKEALEKGSTSSKVDALKQLIRLHVNGEPQNSMIMTVIKYAVPVDDHLIKKLVLYFWEVIDKRDKDGNLLNVIILICSFLRNDLQHPNEYVRGLTLRFLCKIEEQDLVEPLVSAVVQNLTHRVAYVRRNAVLAVHSIFKKFPDLLPDAPDLVETFIGNETDVTARRNAFDMLAVFTPERAARFLIEFKDTNNMSEAGSCFLMSVVDFCGQMIRQNPYDRAKYVSILFSVLQDKAPAVRFQCAATLLNLSASPTAIRQATQTYIDILKSHSDNSVRLIVVQQLELMRGRFLEGLQDSLMDLLSALQDSLIPVRKRIINLAVGLITNKNIDFFIQAMKKELLCTQNESDAFRTAVDLDYRQIVIKSIGIALLHCPKAAASVLPVLLDFVSDDTSAAGEVVNLIKVMLQDHPEMRASTVEKLIEVFPSITLSGVMRCVLLLLSNHAESRSEILKVLNLIMEEMGSLPLTLPKTTTSIGCTVEALNSSGHADKDCAKVRAMTTVREDGTYMTAYTTTPANAGVSGSGADISDEQDESTKLRSVIVHGDYFLASTLADVLPKLVTRLFIKFPEEVDVNKEMQSNAIELLNEILRYGTDEGTLSFMEDDCQERLHLSLLLLANPLADFLVDIHQNSSEGSVRPYQGFGKTKDDQKLYGGSDGFNHKNNLPLCPVDAPLFFTQITEGGSGGKDAMCTMEAADSVMGPECDGAMSLDWDSNADQFSNKPFLQRIEETITLSGFCDPIYCEASIEVHQIDIMVNWLLVNRCDQLLSNVTIELTSLCGMRLVERPQSYVLAPYGSLQTRTALKVGAAESGVLYGNIFFDSPQHRNGCIILNDIHVNIMNYVKPAYCQLSEFRSKWGVFDWENKVEIVTSKRQICDYIDFIVNELNMQLLDDNLEGYNGEKQFASSSNEDDAKSHEYMSCNFYARTIFDEDALVNVSIEHEPNGMISGVVRVRSNVKAVAYGIGEKLNALQRAGC
ncbi:unnamed protein product [Phytomonas sp. EM1]|nr:unnamed protein product [Phytomonas sp. EM1]|eukprot:CCW64477.1 unnamed protein product [Phytomonas sp. isolate EM1]